MLHQRPATSQIHLPVPNAAQLEWLIYLVENTWKIW